MTKPYTLHLGDCIEVMKSIPDNSVDSIVCDPPYGLSKEPDMVEVLKHWLAGDDYQHKGSGFMSKSWDSFVPGPSVWREAMRVLKPGGHLLAFFGSRTYDLGTLAIRLAGFEIRDQIMWVYGSGFPKSMDVSKAIDKAGGVSPRVQSDLLKAKRTSAGLSRDQVADHVGCTAASVRDWEEGRARSTGASLEWITPSEQYRSALADLLGYSADERVVAGVAIDRAGDETVIGLGHSGILRTGGHTEAARQWEGCGTALKPAHEPICVARKPLVGTVAANVLAHGTGALNIDGCRVDGWKRSPGFTDSLGVIERSGSLSGVKTARANVDESEGRWPANLIHDGSDEVIALFPQAAGQQAAVRGSEPSAKTANAFGEFAGRTPAAPRGDTGSAARFFYCAKASRADRNAGLTDPGPQFTRGTTLRDVENTPTTGNTHPTVKPTDLMAYLCRLITPRGGVVLDPFMGSGSTGKAAMREGFRFIGIDITPEYHTIAAARIEHELAKVAAAAAVQAVKDAEPQQLSLIT